MEKRHFDIPHVCIQCGKVLDDGDKGTIEHYIPLCVIGSKSERKAGINHPLITVVNDPHNLFRICNEEEHQAIDSRKVAAFLGLDPADSVQTYLAKIRQPSIKRGDPVALIEFLMKEYPVTCHPKFRAVQIRRMITVNNRFRKVAYHLNGELDLDLKDEYHKAAALVGPFNRYLHSLRSLPVDLGSNNWYDLTHQTSDTLSFPRLGGIKRKLASIESR